MEFENVEIKNIPDDTRLLIIKFKEEMLYEELEEVYDFFEEQFKDYNIKIPFIVCNGNMEVITDEDLPKAKQLKGDD